MTLPWGDAGTVVAVVSGVTLEDAEEVRADHIRESVCAALPGVRFKVMMIPPFPENATARPLSLELKSVSDYPRRSD